MSLRNRLYSMIDRPLGKHGAPPPHGEGAWDAFPTVLEPYHRDVPYSLGGGGLHELAAIRGVVEAQIGKYLVFKLS